VIYVGEEREEKVTIDITDYTATELQKRRIDDIEECLSFKDSPTITWINGDGIHDPQIVETLGKHFDIHTLVLEDIVNSGQRPKFEDATDYFFIVLKMLYIAKDHSQLESEQVSILFGKGWVMTFQETGEDVFGHVRKRLEKTVPRVKFMSSDYLAYSLMDAIVDHYFVVLEQIGERIETLEDEISGNPTMESLGTIRDLKKQLILMRKAVWPLREVIGALERAESDLVKDSTSPYLRDLYEHTIQVIDTVETFRDMVSGLLDLYHTGVSNRMNEVMKVLTIFATIFIPLGFLAGVYGMNFDTEASPFNLPELGLKFGYPLFWGCAVLIAGGLLLFFRSRRWL